MTGIFPQHLARRSCRAATWQKMLPSVRSIWAFLMSPEQRISTRPCLSSKQKVNARMKRAAETKSEMLLGLVAV